MKTNLEKWNYYLDEIKQKEQEFINRSINDLPEFMYEVFPSGKLRELNIVDVFYINRLYCGGKPTRKDVAKIKAYSENMPELIVDNILVSWKCGDTSSAVKYTELKGRYFTDESDAVAKSNEVIATKQKEAELLNNGHIKCMYCGKVVPDKEAVSYTIIFQNSRQDPFSRSGYKKFVDRKINKYCSKQCGVHDQMAHEG